MSEWLAILAAAAFFGINVAVSPCPMATNVAAISFIARRVENPKLAALTGLLYSLGRTVTYVAIAFLLVRSVLSSASVSFVLSYWMNRLLGPLLILVGMVLLGMLPMPTMGGAFLEKCGKRVADWGVFGGFLLGILFALSFCPTSAAWYFGSLIPLAIKAESSVAVPFVFGIATALPVIGFALLLAFGSNLAGRVFSKITQLEKGFRIGTGVLFIGIGIGFTLKYIWKLF